MFFIFRHRFIIVAVLCATVISVPFLSVRFTPITDLPQLTTQIRLFGDAWHNPETTIYKIQWLSQGKLPYLIMGLLSWFCSPEKVGSYTMMFLGILWVAGIFTFAKAHNRSLSNAILACLYFFNHTMYYGLYNFVAGLPFFLFWIHLLKEDNQSINWTKLPLLLLSGFLLYWSHVLWLAAGLIWLIIFVLLARLRKKNIVYIFLALLPLIVVVIVWCKDFMATTMVTENVICWLPVFNKLSLDWLINNAFGGIILPVEKRLFILSLFWVVIPFWENRFDLSRKIERNLLIIGVLFILFVMTAPSLLMSTVNFGERWLPSAMVIMLLAVPAPKFSYVYLKSVVAMLLLTIFSLRTTHLWRNFEKYEMSGLDEVLETLPDNKRVLGLSFVKRSQFIKNPIFTHIFAYAQAFKGGELNVSFAHMATSLVVYKTDQPRPWTHSLEIKPELVKTEDFEYFDLAIINANENGHVKLVAKYPIKPLTDTGRWRLYKIEKKNR